MPRKIKNRLNDLNSKEWLLFQKSWFIHNDSTYEKFISFFTKSINENGEKSIVGTLFDDSEKIKLACDNTKRNYKFITDSILLNYQHQNSLSKTFDYIILDFLNKFKSYNEYYDFINQNKQVFITLSHLLKDEKYLTVFINNINSTEIFCPIAWELAKELGQIFALKDERIGLLDNDVFYCLILRKESGHRLSVIGNQVSSIKHQASSGKYQVPSIPFGKSWFIIRPERREKSVILHPAKFPEMMVEEFIRTFTNEGDKVFDPMAGTGTTIISALKLNRKAFGIELNPTYKSIIDERVKKETRDEGRGTRNKTQIPFSSSPATCPLSPVILCADASKLDKYPQIPDDIDYCITSPPYWDMLHSKGMETQRKRREKGLDVKYSDDDKDIGNIHNYQDFLNKLVDIYIKVANKLKVGGFMTIVVKNVKKKGTIYPLAWDLASLLISTTRSLILHSEQFWCQDDIRLAPYGYGNAWVSNTHHHYCLNFKKI